MGDRKVGRVKNPTNDDAARRKTESPHRKFFLRPVTQEL